MNDQAISDDINLGQKVKRGRCHNLSGCEIGNETRIGAFVEVQKNAMIGEGCKISSQTFIRHGVAIGDGVLTGAGSVVTKDGPPGRNPGGPRCRIAAKTVSFP